MRIQGEGGQEEMQREVRELREKLARVRKVLKQWRGKIRKGCAEQVIEVIGEEG